MPSRRRRGAAPSGVQPAEFEDAYFTQFTPEGRPYARDPERLEFWHYLADRIVADLGPRTVLDAGCAIGLLVEALRDRGVEAYGFDISEFALEQVRPDIRQYTWRQSILEPPPRRYDLIVCIEVVEHLPPEHGERAVENLAGFTDDVLFSSTPLDYHEPTHLNVRQPEHWAEVFARQGLYRDVDYDPSTFIAPPAVRFRRARDPIPRQVAGYERLVWQLKLENLALREVAQEARLERARRLGAETQLERITDTAAYRLSVRIRDIVRWIMPLDSRIGMAVTRMFARLRPPDPDKPVEW